MKFTFKTIKPTGKWRSFDSSDHIIKLDKMKVGSIDDKPPHKIWLCIIKEDINEDGNPNCEWKSIRLKKESATLEEAKDYLNNNIETIMAKFKLKQLD